MKSKTELEPSLEAVALQIYGSTDSAAYRRWVEYWKASRERNRELIRNFTTHSPLSLAGKTVLDIGCGTGGLGDLIGEECQTYVGAEYHQHVLQFSRPRGNVGYLQASGIDLPFPSESFDLILNFDVIEHLEGGSAWQIRSLKEMKRVLNPMGMIFLTTPNFWYPFDAHTELYFPQYLPRFLQDRYIRRFNPYFHREHASFKNIPLVKPGFLKRALKESGLVSLHDLPCCLDRSEYLRLHPIRGALSYLGLGWYTHAEFWTIIVHQEARRLQRRKLKSSWFYETNQPADGTALQFGPRIDFNQSSFGHQLGEGWYWHERDERGFRWIGKRAIFYLESTETVRYLLVKGFTPRPNRLKISVNGTAVGEHWSSEAEGFELKYLLPFRRTDKCMFEIEIEAKGVFKAENPEDHRELSTMIFSAEVTK